MDIAQAKELAQELMQLHGLTDWGLRFDRARTRLGYCSRSRKYISLSAPITAGQPESAVRNTVLHEIAHALTPGHGHDTVWRNKAINIGCNGDVCSPIASPVPPKYSVFCPFCQTVIASAYRRRTLTHSFCRKCGRASLGRLQLQQAEPNSRNNQLTPVAG